MRYKEAVKLSDVAFVRLTGVTHGIAQQMLDVLEAAEPVKQSELGGRPSPLTTGDKLMMMLEYWREYRTFFHIGASFGVSESTAHKHVSWAQKVLAGCRQFTLPGKKVLRQRDNGIEVIYIDATESPIERPKKNRN